MKIHSQIWPTWKKIVFRFLFIYLMLFIAPWTWLDSIPGIAMVTQFYYTANDWLVTWANTNIFHVRPVLVPFNGSGDTSFGWTQLWLYLLLALIGCIVWSVFDKRSSYNYLDFWMRTFLRYYVAMVAMSYGIIKLFALQMPFPNLSQFATPLGDFLPMRFSWMFIGYSTPYQFFAGAMEVITGLLLLNRRTITAGLLMGFGVFMQVAIMNLCFDIPVKIYSIQLFTYCIILLGYDAPRLIQLFILNKSAGSNQLYEISFEKKWMNISRWVLKGVFIIMFVVLPFYESWSRYKSILATPIPKPFYGVYDVPVYVVNNDTIPMHGADTLRWKDIIFDKNGSGSVNAQDTTFRQRYRRGYFSYVTDTVQQTLSLRKFSSDSLPMITMKYRWHQDGTVKLYAQFKGDSLRVTLRKKPRHFQLAEKQFHWLSEYNR